MIEHWSEDAACRGADPGIFFPERRMGVAMRGQYDEARRYCRRCLVKDDCLLDALQTEQVGERPGMRGGLMPSQRDVLGIRSKSA